MKISNLCIYEVLGDLQGLPTLFYGSLLPACILTDPVFYLFSAWNRSENGIYYLATPISDAQLASLKSGNTDILSLFLNSSGPVQVGQIQMEGYFYHQDISNVMEYLDILPDAGVMLKDFQ